MINKQFSCSFSCEGFLAGEEDGLPGEVADKPDDIIIPVLGFGKGSTEIN